MKESYISIRIQYIKIPSFGSFIRVFVDFVFPLQLTIPLAPCLDAAKAYAATLGRDCTL